MPDVLQLNYFSSSGTCQACLPPEDLCTLCSLWPAEQQDCLPSLLARCSNIEASVGHPTFSFLWCGFYLLSVSLSPSPCKEYRCLLCSAHWCISRAQERVWDMVLLESFYNVWMHVYTGKDDHFSCNLFFFFFFKGRITAFKEFLQQCCFLWA